MVVDVVVDPADIGSADVGSTCDDDNDVMVTSNVSSSHLTFWWYDLFMLLYEFLFCVFNEITFLNQMVLRNLYHYHL